jgi:hypothetical protein
MLNAIGTATDWKIVVPVVITGLTGLVGTWIGAWGAVRAAETAQARRSLAAALRGELLAYFDLVARRKQVETAEECLQRMRAGGPPELPSLVGAADTPLPSAVLHGDVREIGSFGPQLAEDVFRLMSMIAAVRSTLIRVARGDFQGMDRSAAVALLEGELTLWREVETLGDDVARRLGREARR